MAKTPTTSTTPVTTDDKLNYLIDRVDELHDRLNLQDETLETLTTKIDELNLPSGSGFGVLEYES